jgi:hypothetical protein
MYLRHFQYFWCLLKRIKILNFFSTCSTFNALFSKSLIFFSHRVDVDVAFLKKSKLNNIRKIKKKKYLDKRDQNAKEENEGLKCFWNQAMGRQKKKLKEN